MRAGAPLVCGMCAEAAEYRDDIVLRFGVLLIYCDVFAFVMLYAAVDCLFFSFSLINKNKKHKRIHTRQLPGAFIFNGTLSPGGFGVIVQRSWLGDCRAVCWRSGWCTCTSSSCADISHTSQSASLRQCMVNTGGRGRGWGWGWGQTRAGTWEFDASLKLYRAADVTHTLQRHMLIKHPLIHSKTRFFFFFNDCHSGNPTSGYIN